MEELLFEVTQEADGGYCAECLTESIFTEGDTWEQILASYPQLKAEDIQAALLFAAEAVNRFEMIPAVD